MTYRKQGHLKEAKVEVMEKRKELLGEDHLETGRFRVALGLCRRTHVRRRLGRPLSHTKKRKVVIP